MPSTPLEVKEAQLQSQKRNAEDLNRKIQQQKDKLAAAKKVRSEVEAQVKLTRARAVSLRSVVEDEMSELERRQENQRQLQNELEEAEHDRMLEVASIQVCKRTQDGLFDARAALIAVRKELSKLGTEEVREAALRAQGADLPVEVVAATPALDISVGLVDPERLWRDYGAPGEVPDTIRLACTSQGVIAALQRATTVRASDMREGLRQWSFARAATTKTATLLVGLKAELEETNQRASAFQEETLMLHKDHQAEAGKLPAQRHADKVVRARCEELQAKYDSIRSSFKGLQVKRDRVREAIEDKKKEYRLLCADHDKAARHLEAEKAALDEHHAEAERQAHTAETLSRRMQGQADKGLQELSQAATNLASFQQAHIALKEAASNLNVQMEEEISIREKVDDDRKYLNMELEALARLYLEELPPLPGSEALIKPASVPASRQLPPLEAGFGPLLSGSNPRYSPSPSPTPQPGSRSASPGSKPRNGRVMLSF